MAYSASTTVNHGQSSNDADGTVTATIPGAAGDLVLLLSTVNSGTATSTCTDNGDPANPWTRVNSPNPDVVASNTDVSIWAKKLGAGDVGKTVTYQAGIGGVRLPVALAAFSGRGSVADILRSRTADTTTGATVDPADLVIGDGAGWDVVQLYAARVATGTQLTMTGVPSAYTKRAEAATNFGASPNMTVTIVSRDGVGPGTYGTVAATYSASANQAIEYTLGLPPGTPVTSVDAGPDQTGVEPWSTVTLSGSDDGASVVSRVWAQTAGPAVTLTGSGQVRTFEAPAVNAGATLTFTYTATNSDGAVGSDSVSVTVLPVAERVLIAGTWTPAKVTLAPEAVEPPEEPEPEPGPAVLPGRPDTGHAWTMWSRTADYELDQVLPIVSAKFVRRHMGVSTAVVETPFSAARWASLAPSCGVVIYRDGVQQFTGRVSARQVEWDAEDGRAVIHVEAQGDEVLLADRLVFPDPLRAADDQTVNDYWTKSGVPASTAMLQLISDQAGPTCRERRRIDGLTLADDPGVGVVRSWKALFLPVLDQLALMSVASGADLGLRVASEAGGLEFGIYAPRGLTSSVRFSADLSNLVGFTYREEAPKVTDALAAGQGDLHLRLRKRVATTGALALSWGRQIWSYIDRRDTADTADLIQSAADAVTEGDATVSLAVKLTDSQAATYGLDWDLGDRITVLVGLPGQEKLAAVSDVVREILLEVDENGAEQIRPAIGSYDAKAVIPTPTQRQLAAVGDRLGGLIARK